MHKCLSYSLITTSKSSNLCTSSHAIKSKMYKQNQKDFPRLVVRFGYKNSLVFLGFKELDSKRAQILDLSKWSFLIQLACSLAFHFHLLLTLLHQHTFSLIAFFFFFFFLTHNLFVVCADALSFFLYIPFSSTAPNLGWICLEPYALIESKQCIWRESFRFRVQFIDKFIQLKKGANDRIKI